MKVVDRNNLMQQQVAMTINYVQFEWHKTTEIVELLEDLKPSKVGKKILLFWSVLYLEKWYQKDKKYKNPIETINHLICLWFA